LPQLLAVIAVHESANSAGRTGKLDRIRRRHLHYGPPLYNADEDKGILDAQRYLCFAERDLPED